MTVTTPQLLRATLKNIRSDTLNRQMIGFYLEKKLDPITPDHIIQYAQATRDPNPGYLSPHPPAPPFFLSCLIWDSVKEILVNHDLHLNFFRLVHAEQRVQWHSPIHAGEDLRARISIKDIVETRAGEMLEISGAVYKKDGIMAAEATAGLMIRKKSDAQKTVAGTSTGDPDAGMKESARLEIQTGRGQNLEYARASGDTSFIHTSDILARLTGLPGAIMHGICLLSMACSAYSTKFLGCDNTRLTGAYARFTYPALPGQTLTMICGQGPPGETPFRVVNQSGKTVLSRGSINYQGGIS